MVLDAVSAWKSLLTGDAGYFVAVLQAHIDFVKWILSQQSLSNFAPLKKGKPLGICHTNIVWQYFINKKRTFKEITGT
jgi:hypothetical protein